MFQQVMIVGNLGRDPEMRYTPSGVPVTSFNVATSRNWTNAAGERVEETTWFRVTCWRKLAEVTANYLAKGRRVLVIGTIKANAYTDKDGNAAASLELTADTVKFLSSKGEGESDPARDDEGFAQAMKQRAEEEDLDAPF